MRIIGVIPARYGSSRLPGKPLVELCGKPMIQHIYERCKQAHLLEEVIVATDDDRIARAVKEFGGTVTLTSAQHTSGTDRIIEVVADMDVDIIVNIQGDEPLIHPAMINDLAAALRDDPALVMATLKYPLHKPGDIQNSNIVKVVTDKDGFALYFSRSPIPNTSRHSDPAAVPVFKHIGMYAYTKNFLVSFKHLKSSKLEMAESLEQLRALDHGFRIKVLETKYNTVGVDTPEDINTVTSLLQRQ
ncbi:MAG: 3-deoxy-manno-octulosonate cytidylyltransferase [Candidatus Omnitrophica bacterium]|nr:3-deoxy-manno-octulosonate cytidylyltransferase [Candidatus Omnitrophota bacterium]